MRMRTGLVATLVAIVVIPAAASSGAEAATFTYTGSEQTFAVPANVTGVSVLVVGAQGASFSTDIVTEAGGYGSKITATALPVSAGTSTLYVEVGGVGTDGSGGWNGGGTGPFGGGGASDIRTISCSADGGDCATGGSAASLNSRLAVAGGGGGASDVAPGGPNWVEMGISCNPICGSDATNAGGGTAVSAADVTSYCQGQGDQDGEAGSAGDFGVGGVGASAFLAGTPVSGGGGGGWYGGGGGAQCYDSGAVATANAGSGGDGSDYLNPIAPGGSVSIAPGDATDPAEVIITAPVPTATTTPRVAGGLTVGDVLSETNAQWSSSEMPLTGYTYQWQRCNASGTGCTAIDGATAQTYTLVAEDLGDTIRVQETAENFYGSSAAPATSATTGVVGEPPTPTAAPAISGTPTDGQVMLETHGTWTDGPITGYGYQWQRCRGAKCTAITGAIHQSYTLTAADVGSRIEVQETATNAYGTSVPATSAATSTVHPAAATSFILLASPNASAKGVGFTILCRAAVGTVCRGSAQLTTLERLLRSKILALVASAKRHSKRVLVGYKSFTLPAGAQKEIVVPLNRLGHRLLARFHRIPATLTITLVNTTPPTNIIAQTTIKPKKHKQ